jgi:hypothetical protein
MVNKISGPNKGSLYQRRVGRSSLTSALPIFLLAFLLADLGWEAIKGNLNPHIREAWPWKFTLLNLSTSATLVGIFASLIIARSQFARSMAPSLVVYSASTGSQYIKRSRRTLYIYNAGPGRATVRAVRFKFTMADIPAIRPSHINSDRWYGWEEIMSRLEDLGLKHKKDYFLRNYGTGTALPPTGQGLESLAFNSKALTRIKEFAVLVQVEDVLGDIHERVLRCIGITGSLVDR